eukprot:CAMPEP_0118986086 /NCGR_PEP_ID=MMETSP1173-20130426/41440_1 /TAXON_ID=1034831 /ORGANISM="Rhizochromulina marina cf, Strain CCMP1243" /LENGTH=36 /DNA_ID= /DNA_START= /DNA_END= /DNA_ORIENTATION=
MSSASARCSAVRGANAAICAAIMVSCNACAEPLPQE